MAAYLWFGFFVALVQPGDHGLLAIYLFIAACWASDLEKKARRR